MKTEKSILTEVVSMRVSKEDKIMIRDLQEKYYFDIFQYLRDIIKREYNKKINESCK